MFLWNLNTGISNHSPTGFCSWLPTQLVCTHLHPCGGHWFILWFNRSVLFSGPQEALFCPQSRWNFREPTKYQLPAVSSSITIIAALATVRLHLQDLTSVANHTEVSVRLSVVGTSCVGIKMRVKCHLFKCHSQETTRDNNVFDVWITDRDFYRVFKVCF